MRSIERVKAVQAITRKMNSTMSFGDVKIFFKEEGISLSDSEYYEENSYHIEDLVRDYLVNCNPIQLIDIADQLDLELTIADQRTAKLGDSSYWLAGHLRLFISHVHTHKKQAAGLKNSLLRYGISSFVAHDDIEVSAEWREEILRALMTMDLLAALVSEDFNSSKWTDQEVGVAIARDTTIIPINIKCQPYGFLEHLQNFKATGMSASKVADLIFITIAKNPKTKDALIECLKKLLLTTNDPEIAIDRAHVLDEIPEVSPKHWEDIRDNISANNQLIHDVKFLDSFNVYLKKNKLEPLIPKATTRWVSDDEIPF